MKNGLSGCQMLWAVAAHKTWVFVLALFLKQLMLLEYLRKIVRITEGPGMLS